MNAVITAGGRVDGAYARAAGTTVKALACTNGTSMLERAIASARGAGAQRIAVVGGAEVRDACASFVEDVVDESDDGAENLQRALRAGGNGAFLYLTSDLPYITADTLSIFTAAVPANTLGMAVASFDTFARRFPGSPPYGITLGRERVVNGGTFVLPAGAATSVSRLAAAFFDARKSSWKMARLLGPGLLLRFAVRRLGISALEARASRDLGFAARAIRDCPPELCYDADTIAEFTYACNQP